MLLTITTTYQPATDLGYLLHKNPANVQTFSLSFGKAHIFYPEASIEQCTAALLLDVDSVHLVRGKDRSAAMEQYVNDRPYVASSFLSVAIAEVLGTALNGRCARLPELAQSKLPLQATLSVVPCRSGEGFLKRLFEPLGYTVTLTQHMLDEEHQEWGLSNYFTVKLEATCRLSELLAHLYVLVPVLDDEKHYWIGDDEVEKLLRHGKGWLEAHPEREHIAYRYLKHKPNLARVAIARLITEERTEQEETDNETTLVEEAVMDTSQERMNLHTLRLKAVIAALRESNARRVLDLGCGEGKLLKTLLQDKRFDYILGLDVSYRALELAQNRLHIDRLPPKQKERISLVHGALTYRDKRLEGYDAAAVVEVIEHLDPARLAAFERVLFEFARPITAIVTTPNAEYNVKFTTLQAGKFRHKDHRFEWSQDEFQSWANRVASQFGYTVRFLPIGPEDETVGAPSQMGIFSRGE
jgi:3' terminal RNA ribose 2'-O-methyltransferase Hen1